LTKRAFNRAVFAHLETILDYEAHLQEIAARDPEHLRRVQLFLERRKNA
jgi:enoyl-CoA hydratase/carnithine racemase